MSYPKTEPVRRDAMREGDFLIFKSATRAGCKKAKRRITGIDRQGRPLVTFNGWRGFVVRLDEILGVERPQ